MQPAIIVTVHRLGVAVGRRIPPTEALFNIGEASDKKWATPIIYRKRCRGFLSNMTFVAGPVFEWFESDGQMEDAACRSASAAPMLGAGTFKQSNRKGGRESYLKLSDTLAYLHSQPF
jgi:hypothetical protein